MPRVDRTTGILTACTLLVVGFWLVWSGWEAGRDIEEHRCATGEHRWSLHDHPPDIGSP